MKKWIAAVMLVALVAIDQVTKYMAKAFLEGKEAFPIIKNILELQYLEGGNTGAAFGLFSGKTLALAVVSFVAFLILLFDKVLVKTAKKSPHVNMEKIAFFSYKYKKVMPVLFVILFIVAFILQQKTGYRFSSIGEDSISKIIPRNNVVVTLYDNKDEDKIAKIVSKLEKEEKVDNIISYPTTIGKQVDVEEMQDMIGDYTAGSDMSLFSLENRVLFLLQTGRNYATLVQTGGSSYEKIFNIPIYIPPDDLLGHCGRYRQLCNCIFAPEGLCSLYGGHTACCR